MIFCRSINQYWTGFFVSKISCRSNNSFNNLSYISKQVTFFLFRNRLIQVRSIWFYFRNSLSKVKDINFSSFIEICFKQSWNSFAWLETLLDFFLWIHRLLLSFEVLAQVELQPIPYVLTLSNAMIGGKSFFCVFLAIYFFPTNHSQNFH